MIKQGLKTSLNHSNLEDIVETMSLNDNERVNKSTVPTNALIPTREPRDKQGKVTKTQKTKVNLLRSLPKNGLHLPDDVSRQARFSRDDKRTIALSWPSTRT